MSGQDIVVAPDIYVGHCFSHSNHRLIVRAGNVAAAQQKLPAVTQQTATIKRTAPMAALVSVGPKQGKVGEQQGNRKSVLALAKLQTS